MEQTYDVVIIGGGAAGLSAAVALARFRRSVLVVDDGAPRNAGADHVHNFLTRDGASPAELLALGRAEATRYGAEIVQARVESAQRRNDGFVVELDGRSVAARRMLLAAGLRDELPEIDGLAALWGTSVLHCPYCHGWEVRDRRIGVLSTGPMAVHQALLFRQLSPQVTMLAHTGPAPTDDELEMLHALGVVTVAGEVVSVESTAEGLRGVRLVGGRLVELDALVVAPRMAARAELLAPIGLQPVDVVIAGHVIGTRVEADAAGRTSVPGVFVAGNVSDPQAQVISSAAAGLTVGAAINADLLMQDNQVLVERHRAAQIHGQTAWEERYRSQAQTWSGRPNAALVDEIAGLPTGTALEAGSGEGADAMWLAAQGWRVTGVDISTVALGRAAAEADRHGLQINWQHQDLTMHGPDRTYDLVSAFYLHMPREPREALFANLATAVAPGGTLLIVGHDHGDLLTTVRRPPLAEMGWDVHELAASFGPEWTVEVAEVRPRPVTDADGHPVTIADTVLRARRAAATNG